MKNILALVVFGLGLTCGYSQIGATTQQRVENRWRIGAGAGLGFGDNGYLGISIAPSVGYYMGNGLEVGATVGYQLNKNDYYSMNLISGGPYVNYSFLPQLFGRAHYEYYTGTQKNKVTEYKNNINESALWVGGGYESTSGPVRFRAGIMYNVLETDNSIFSSRVRPFAGVIFAM